MLLYTISLGIFQILAYRMIIHFRQHLLPFTLATYLAIAYWYYGIENAVYGMLIILAGAVSEFVTEVLIVETN